MKDFVSFAIGYMACLACWVLVFECLINIYWVWVAFVVATCTAGAAYELTYKYTKSVAIPATLSIARGAALLVVDAYDECIQFVRRREVGRYWRKEYARRDEVRRQS